MAEDSVIQDPDPLKPSYIPENLVDRDKVVSQLSNFDGTRGRNLLLHGPRGTGKTALLHHLIHRLEPTTCYTSCNRHSTQYQVLKHIIQVLTKEEVGTGHHTADLQRKLEERTGHTPIVLILDELDFLLLNDGDNLLYYLSRLENQDNLSLILVSSNHSNLKGHLEERTYSSLQPRRIQFEPYSGETIFELLKTRAEKALKPRTLHREALSYIASTTSNASYALDWLKAAAENTEEQITEQQAASIQDQAYRNYTDQLLQTFSQHHRLLYQAIKELREETEKNTIRTGPIYQRYQDLCQNYSEDSLSNRRISDYIKHLELLNLITAEYHYGGTEGKTRDIKLQDEI